MAVREIGTNKHYSVIAIRANKYGRIVECVIKKDEERISLYRDKIGFFLDITGRAYL